MSAAEATTSFAVKGAAGMPFARYQPLIAGRVRVDDRQDLRPDRALRAQRVELVREERLGLGARDEVPPGQRERERIEPGHVERCDARRAADELEEQPAVRRGDPARAECDIGLGLARDVSDAEAVSHDRHAGAGRSRACRLSEPSPSGAGLKNRRRSRGVTLPRSGVSPS